MLEIILLSGLSICIVITLFQIIKKDHWIIRFSDFPHAQLTAMTVLFLVGAVVITGFLGPWYVVVIKVAASISVVYQLWIIFPYTFLSSKQSKDSSLSQGDQIISILESNVFMKNQEYSRLIDLIMTHKPDIVITLESDKKWQKALSAIEGDYPHSIKCPYDNTYGMHLYSKLKLVDSNIQFLIEEGVPSIETNLQLRNGKTVRLYIVHPKPPSPTQNTTSTERDAELIIIAKKARASNLPVIVAGDLNDVAWSHTTRLFQRISGLLDPRIGRGFFNTFHAKYPVLRWPLDHIFHSRDFLISKIKRLPGIGSDHFPMLINLSYEPTNGRSNNGKTEKVTKEDWEESKEKVQEVTD